MDIQAIKTYKYDKEYDSFCYQNCIKLILAANGVENPNFYINMTLSFWLRDEEKKIEVFDDNARSLLPEYQEMVSRVRYEYEDGITERVWKENLRLVQSGEPIIVGVDSYNLEYLPYYRKSHGRHTVVLDGFDEQTKMVSIVDWFEPWFFVGQVPLKQFLEARSSMNDYDGGIYSGIPVHNNWARVKRFNVDDDCKRLIRTQLKMSYEQYFLEHSNGNEYNGCFATIQLKKILESAESNLKSEEKKELLKNIHSSLYIINRRRDLFSLLVKEAYQEVQSSKMLLLLDKTKEFFKIWETYIYKVIKSYIKYKEGNLYKLVDELDNVIKFEAEYKGVLKDALDDLC